jgi:hypothetical protein
MPFASQAQRRFMYARHPEIARRWRKESGPQRGLPEKSRRRGRRRDRRDEMVERFIAKNRD